MAFGREKCVRCSEPTRGEYDGKPTCETCRNELEVALAEAREVRRACPGDSEALRKEIVHGIIIDRCPKCGGVWLDSGELERMNGEVATEVWRSRAMSGMIG